MVSVLFVTMLTFIRFLQSCIFVFIKHPYDVGDRVQIYGNSGDLGRGDDYFVKEIALFYTEFKKMQGHVVQAPNSYLNTLFILNHRRSGALAEAVPIIIKFGTTLEQIENLRNMLLEFVTSEKREYQTNILTELRAVQEVHWLELNVVFFYKSNWQNELLRLQRRNKFICALTMSIQECGIEGPRMRYPGQKESFPVYLQNLQNNPTPGVGQNGSPDNPGGVINNQPQDAPFVPTVDGTNDASSSAGPARRGSILRQPGQHRGESIAAMGRRVDFSLGMKGMMDDPSGDVLDDRDTAARQRATVVRVTSPSRSQDRARTSQDTGHSIGHSTGIQRVGTNSSLGAKQQTHRNRFFSRSRHGDEEIGMANIPEGDLDSSSTGTEKIDPRSGLISPRAVRSSEDTRPPMSSGALHPVTSMTSESNFNAPQRARTDNFEMRRM